MSRHRASARVAPQHCPILSPDGFDCWQRPAKVNRPQAKNGLSAIHLKFADFWSRHWGVPYSTEENRECAFGQFVSGDGTYKKTSSARPKFGVDTSFGYVEPQERKAVSGAEVTGTFRSYFTGKFKGSYNEILIQALGGNRLKIQMKLVYPFEAAAGTSVNVGEASGEAVIQDNTAVFTPKESGACKITLEFSMFSRPGTLIVTTENNSECGFGLNVSADGTYKKTSGAKPKFGVN